MVYKYCGSLSSKSAFLCRPFTLVLLHPQPSLRMATSRLPSFPPIAVSVLILLVSFPFLFAFSLEDTGSTLYLDSIPYYIPATPFTTVDSASLEDYHAKKSSSGLLPVTVVNVQKNKFGIKELNDVVSNFAKDDVWGEGFLGGEL